MSNFLVANAQNLQQYLKATGSGTDADPFVVSHSINGEVSVDILDQVRDAVENLSTLTEAQVQGILETTIGTAISDFFQGSGYWSTLAQTELKLKKESIGRIVMYNVTATDQTISISADHPWFGRQVEFLSWFHNASQTTDSVISIVISSAIDPQETFAIQINDQSGTFPPGFIVQDSFLIRRLTAGSSFSLILTGKLADTVEDLFIQ